MMQPQVLRLSQPQVVGSNSRLVLRTAAPSHLARSGRGRPQRTTSPAPSGHARSTDVRAHFFATSPAFTAKHKDLKGSTAWYAADEEQQQQQDTNGKSSKTQEHKATRSDVRLMTELTTYVRRNKLSLPQLLRDDAILSMGHSQRYCRGPSGSNACASCGASDSSSAGTSVDRSTDSGADGPSFSALSLDGAQLVDESDIAGAARRRQQQQQGLPAGCSPACREMVNEYVGGYLRVGERLPNWFVHAKFRQAAKLWLAYMTSEGPHTTPSGDGSLSGEPWGRWDAHHHHAVHLTGWELDEHATAEDVAALHAFSAHARQEFVDVPEWLLQAFNVDPFSWCVHQYASGTVEEPETYLLEKFFTYGHVEGEPLPLWYCKWGVREGVLAWARKHAALQQQRRQQAEGQQQQPQQQQEERVMTSSVSSAASSTAASAMAAPAAARHQDGLSRSTPAELGAVVKEALQATAARMGRQLPGLQVRDNVLLPWEPTSSASAQPNAALHRPCLEVSVGQRRAIVEIPAQASVQPQQQQAGGSNGSSGSGRTSPTASLEAQLAAILSAKARLDWGAFLLQRQLASSGAAGPKGPNGSSLASSAQQQQVAKVLLLDYSPGGAMQDYLVSEGAILVVGQELHSATAQHQHQGSGGLDALVLYLASA